MTRRRIHCQVLEVPETNHLERGRGSVQPRDLLPWADPYIAALLAKVQRRENDWQNDPQAADERADVWDDDWSDAAIDEERAGFAAGFPLDPVTAPATTDDALSSGMDNVYGGWPLLDDLPNPE